MTRATSFPGNKADALLLERIIRFIVLCYALNIYKVMA